MNDAGAEQDGAGTIGEWVLPDLLRPGLRVVFVGFAASEESARRKHYYAKGGNAFWKLLHLAGLTPVQLRPEEDARLLDYGLGATDLIKDAWGRDPAVIAALRAREPDLDAALRLRALALKARLVATAPQIICFNGTHTIAGTVLRKGAQALLADIGQTVPPPLTATHLGPSLLHTVVSTSGAAVGHSRLREEQFRALGALLATLPAPSG